MLSSINFIAKMYTDHGKITDNIWLSSIFALSAPTWGCRGSSLHLNSQEENLYSPGLVVTLRATALITRH